MKPPIFEKMVTAVFDPSTGKAKPSIDGCLAMYSGVSGLKIEDSQINAASLRSIESRSADLISHIDDTIKHLTLEERTQLTKNNQILNDHIVNSTVHITAAERIAWNAKETPAQAQAKADAVQANLDEHINDYDLHLTVSEKGLLNNGVYTKTEIDNKLSQLTTNLDWKEAVQTKADLYIVYPDAQEGWTCNVVDDCITYRYTNQAVFNLEAEGYLEEELDAAFAILHGNVVWVESMGYYKKWNGTDWVISNDTGDWLAISANAIIKATAEKDGLMSKEDFTKLEGIEEYANNYVHPNSDDADAEDKHVSKNQHDNYNELLTCVKEADPMTTVDPEGITTYKYNGIFTPAEREKLALIEDEANYYEHPDTHSADMIEETTDRHFVTAEQIQKIEEAAPTALASETVDGLMSKAMYSKLANISYQANNYIHAVDDPTHPATMIVEDATHQFVTEAEKTKWNNPVLASDTENGLMNKTDKVKLDSIDATKVNSAITKIEKISGGVSTFLSTGTRIVHNFGGTDYVITVNPISLDGTDPLSNVSNIWVEYKINECIVHATIVDDTLDTKFSYILMQL